MKMKAPAWEIGEWLNSENPLSLEDLRGRIVVACAFQMLCPGCVTQAIPQMKSLQRFFGPLGISVIGLHCVFEHHEAMGVPSLRAFLHEFNVTFPVGIDLPGENGDRIPRTMRRYDMQGTPTMLLVDGQGELRKQIFGHVPDPEIGAQVMSLLAEQAQDFGLGQTKR